MTVPVLKGFANIDEIASEQVAPLVSRKIISGEKEMFVLWRMKAGAHGAGHKHPHEQIFYMISGKMEFRLGNEKRTCGPGDVAVIPGGVEHEAWFPEDTVVIDVFTPPREDFFTGEDTYIRQG